jgi:hypothetical protein
MSSFPVTAFPGSPKILKGAIVPLDSDQFMLQYNPQTLTRTLKIKGAEEGGDRSQALRLTGPPVETVKLGAEIDAADQFENPDQNPNTVQYGIFPQLAALETTLYPPSLTLQNNYMQSQVRMRGDALHSGRSILWRSGAVFYGGLKSPE